MFGWEWRFLKRCFAFLAVLAVFSCVCIVSANAVSTQAACAVLMDAESGRVLYAHNAHKQALIASTTKLMTALIAVENTENLDEEITIRAEWTGIEGSSIYLRPNEVISMRGLLYGLLLQSGNDAAVAVACHIAGDVEAFAGMMNEKAEELGMKNSSFSNPSGLNDEEHYSTAYDMALLACACLRNETVTRICASRSATIGIRTFYNHNKLLHRYDGCIGMKTGYTELAGRTLVSAAEREGQTLVCVTLNDANDWNDHEKLLDYGFLNYPAQLICRGEDLFGTVKVTGSLIPAVPVVAGADVRFPLGADECLVPTVEFAHELCAPVSAGMPVGWATWLLNGKKVAETELVCGASAAENACVPMSLRERILRWMGCVIMAADGAHLV